ncbi:glycosyltransferase [Hafnia paralvei]|nr:glycosyltransferase [Hafnia paralvei]RDA62998.1 glycosyltransferase [Hafnia paralvei]RDA63838.1 glycosyltransferase [Hafnia paralvei]RDA75124.1 glycosyltransferase [Hafnia paralvei]RDA75529.1 glycosyltransferase [Hafnia paralvei]
MKTLIFLMMCVAMVAWIVLTLRRKPSKQLASIDAVIPAYNEGPCIAASLTNLLNNPYIHQVICVNDGSTDNPPYVLDTLQREWPGKLVVVHQNNTGKGGALMNGVRRATARQVFLTDADTRVPPDGHGLGYMLAEIERGKDVVGGVGSPPSLDGKDVNAFYNGALTDTGREKLGCFIGEGASLGVRGRIGESCLKLILRSRL